MHQLSVLLFIALVIAYSTMPEQAHGVKRGSYNTIPSELKYVPHKTRQEPLPPVENVGFVLHPTNDQAADLLKRAVKLVRSLGYGAHTAMKRAAQVGDLKLISADDFADSTQLSVVIGGDGSVLWGNLLQQEKVIPMLGINEGRVGHMTLFSSGDLDRTMKRALNRKLRYELRGRLEVKSTVFDGRLYALNEALIQMKPGMVEAEIYDNGEPMRIDRSDNVMVAGPTGSTAYSLGAGGDISRTRSTMIVNAVASLNSDRAIHVDGDHQIAIRSLNKYVHPALLVDYIPVFTNQHRQLIGIDDLYAYKGNILFAERIGEYTQATLTPQDWVTVTMKNVPPAIVLIPNEQYYYRNLEKKEHVRFSPQKK